MKGLNREQNLILAITKNIAAMNNFTIEKELLEDIDWDGLMPELIKHKIFMMAYKCIGGYIPDRYKARYELRYHEWISRNQVTIHEMKRIAAIAEENGMGLILLKGFALSKLIYDDINIRDSYDIDLLVDEKHMENLYYLLSDMGYSMLTGYDRNTGRYNTIDRPVLLYGRDFHEFQCVKYISDITWILTEIKRASSAIPIEHINDFKVNTMEIPLNDNIFKTLNLEYTFLHLTANAYASFEPPEDRTLIDYKARDLIDTYLFIRKYGNDFDWHAIRNLSEKYYITHKIYYMFNQLSQIYGQFISDEIIQIFDPAKSQYKFSGYMDGSRYSWKSHIVNRLLDDGLRSREFAKVRKRRIYEDREYTLKKVGEDAFLRLMDMEAYEHWYVDTLQTSIAYAYTCDKANLYLNMIFDDSLYQKLGKCSIAVSMVDGNISGEILNRRISISKDSTLQIEFMNLQNCSSQNIRLGDKWISRITIPFSALDMEFTESNNRLYYNIHCIEKIGTDGIKFIGQKYKLNEYVFLQVEL